MARKPKPLWLPVKTRTFRKLSPSELEARGISRKAERYVNPEGDVISKRKYQESQLYERTGRRVTLVERALLYLRRIFIYPKEGLFRAAKARTKEAELKTRITAEAYTAAKTKRAKQAAARKRDPETAVRATFKKLSKDNKEVLRFMRKKALKGVKLSRMDIDDVVDIDVDDPVDLWLWIYKFGD